MKNSKRLSSKLTFLYKFLGPFSPIIIAVWVNINSIESGSGAFIPVNLLFLGMFFLVLFQLKDIKKVYYNRKHINVSNFRKSETYSMKNVIEIKGGFLFFYFLYIKTERGIKKIKYLTPASENIFFPFRKIKSVRNFEKLISKTNQ